MRVPVRSVATFTLLTCCIVAARASAASSYQLEVVPTRSDPLASVLWAGIGEDGSVQYQGRVWRGPDDFYDIPKTTGASADGIANGHVAGGVRSPTTPARSLATVWKDGVTKWTTGTLDTVALAVNAQGEAGGYGGLSEQRAYFFSATGQAMVITPPAPPGYPFPSLAGRVHALNDNSVAVGPVAVDPATHGGRTSLPFTWSPTGGLVLHNDYADLDINNLGDRIGNVHFVTAAGDVTTLPFIADGLNNNREIVGHDRYWKDGQTFNLDELVPAGWDITSALDINDAGQIAAFASNGSFSGLVRLTPVPEPTMLFVLPLLLLAGRRGITRQCSGPAGTVSS